MKLELATDVIGVASHALFGSWITERYPTPESAKLQCAEATAAMVEVLRHTANAVTIGASATGSRCVAPCASASLCRAQMLYPRPKDNCLRYNLSTGKANKTNKFYLPAKCLLCIIRTESAVLPPPICIATCVQLKPLMYRYVSI